MKNLILIISLMLSVTLTGCLEGGIKTAGSAVGSSETLTYSWISGNWGGCSATACGTNGTQIRIVICRDSNGATVADSNCASAGVKPVTSQSCSAPACSATYNWYVGAFGACSVTACGQSGVQTRVVECRNNSNAMVADSFCTGTKPGLTQPCATAACPTQSCTLPATLGGGQLAHNASVQAYQTQNVPNGQTCAAPQTRTCNNGALSGSYVYSSCTVLPPTGTANGIEINLDYVDTASSKYTAFKAYVDNKLNGGNPYGFSGVDAAFMFRITNTVSYCNLAVTTAEAQVAAAEARMASNQNPAIAGDSYLEVGHMLAEVAIAYDWCSAQTTNAQRTRWANYANQAIYNVWNYNSATWNGRSAPWSGWSVNNPGNNYFYSFTKATIYWGLASGNSATINLARAKLNMINAYFANMPGGGSLEGTGYGTAHMGLFELFQIWEDSTTEDYANMNAHLTDSVKYWLHATIPARNKLAAIGDQARVSEPEIFDYHRIIGLYAAHLTDNAVNKTIGAWWLSHISVQNMGQGFTRRHDILTPPMNNAAAPNEGLVYRASGAGQLFARSGWETNALWMQFGAGKFNESHAAQDQGAFTLASSDYLTVTANIWSHSGINQSTDIANLVRFTNGGSTIGQVQGRESTMTINSQNVATGAVDVTANLSVSYNNANVTSWTRNMNFTPANRRLVVTDNYTVSASTQGTFQFNTLAQPTVNGNVITAGSLVVTVQTPTNPTITVRSYQTGGIVSGDTFSRGYRVEITRPAGSGQYVVQFQN